MITSQNADNKIRYSELFELATKILNKNWEPETYVEAGTLTEEEFMSGEYYVSYIDPNTKKEFFYRSSFYDENTIYFIKEVNEPAIVISSLADMFSFIGDLSKEDDRFLMLPVDEFIFAIDANKRLINIPDHFKRNGVSVQGDEIAETLLFTIDRYFDAVDLYECETYIQWDNGKDQYVTPVSLIDINTYPGKILFGWPLSSILTGQSGPIRFSVRFIKKALRVNDKNEEEIKINYSFNTLTASININPGLNFNIFDTKPDDPHELFDYVITNSQDNTSSVAKPEFILTIDDGSGIRNKFYLERNEDSGVRSLTLKVRAGSSDLGQMSYQWSRSKNNLFGGPFSAGEDVIEKLDPKPVKVDPRETYYQAVINDLGDIISYEAYQFADKNNPVFGDKDVYVKNNVLTLSGINPTVYNAKDSITGEYWVEATSVLGKSHRTIKSVKVELPTATPIEILTDLVDGVIEKNDNLMVEVKTHDKSYTTYLWKKAPHDNEEEFVVIDDADIELNSLRVIEPGFYKVDIISEVNLDQTFASSKSIRITGKPEAVKFAEGHRFEDGRYAEEIYSNELDAFEPEMAPLMGSSVPGFNNENELDPKLVSDEITYVWYVDEDGSKEGLLDADGEIISGAVPYTKPSASPKLDLTGITSQISLRCIATNYLNGEYTNSESVLYNIYFGNE